jgi:hypothetical protein
MEFIFLLKIFPSQEQGGYGDGPAQQLKVDVRQTLEEGAEKEERREEGKEVYFFYFHPYFHDSTSFSEKFIFSNFD